MVVGLCTPAFGVSNPIGRLKTTATSKNSKNFRGVDGSPRLFIAVDRGSTSVPAESGVALGHDLSTENEIRVGEFHGAEAAISPIADLGVLEETKNSIKELEKEEEF